MNLKRITTKHDEELIQSVRGIVKCETFYRVRIIAKLNVTKGNGRKKIGRKFETLAFWFF